MEDQMPNILNNKMPSEGQTIKNMTWYKLGEPIEKFSSDGC